MKVTNSTADPSNAKSHATWNKLTECDVHQDFMMQFKGMKFTKESVIARCFM